MAGIIMFAGFALMLIIGVPISLPLGVATTAVHHSLKSFRFYQMVTFFKF